MNRVVFASLIILCLLSISSITGLIHLAKADVGTIYIYADGSISSSTAPIYSADKVTYTLTGNINVTSDTDGIDIERNNIILDGAGYTVTGSGLAGGIRLTGTNNVTVRNVTITNFDIGISLDSAPLFTIASTGNSSDNNVLSGNNITNNGLGIGLGSADDNTLSGNDITANWIVGIELFQSDNNTLSGNVMGNEHNLLVSGTVLSDFLQSIDTSNLVDGKPVYYFMNQSNIIVNHEAYPEVGYLGFVNCANVTVQGMNLTNSGQGVQLAFTNDSTVTNNNIANNWYGIWLFSSSNNSVSGNNITASGNVDIYLQYYSSNNSISGNNITGTKEGIEFDDLCNYNSVLGNNIANHQLGLDIWLSSNNNIYQNDLVNNSGQVISYNSTNVWDNGSVGNYWSDYLTKYPNATQVESSGVWNTPYVIDTNNTDNYPLIQPWVPYEGGTITINADGSISPSTAPIYTADNVTYTLTGNVSYPTYNGIVIERNNTVIDGNGYTVQGNQSGNGLFLASTNNVTIKNTNIENFQYGIYLSDSNNNVINGNIATANSYGGIILESSSNNIVIGNNVTANSLVGIELDYSSNSVINGNIATANNYCGIDISYYSNNNTVIGNDASANHYSGFNLYSSSSNNTVSGNNATANSWFGIYLYDSLNNSIYHNDFVNNKLSQSSSINSTNTWDDGYPSGGNYWSDYNGTDVKNGSYQNETGSDGIGDTPYAIDANNTDYFPLMGIFSNFSTLTGYPVNIISNSTISGFVAPIWLEHPEIVTLTFNVTGTQRSTGFCRVSFPTAMMNGTYQVSVNGTEVPYTLLPCSNADYSYLYFTYTQSTEQVIILPEFPSFLVLPMFMIATLLAVIIFKKKGVKARARA